MIVEIVETYSVSTSTYDGLYVGTSIYCAWHIPCLTLTHGQWTTRQDYQDYLYTIFGETDRQIDRQTDTRTSHYIYLAPGKAWR